MGKATQPVGERRIDRGSVSVCIAEARGWVMVRRPACIPYTMTLADWQALEFEPIKAPPPRPSGKAPRP